MATVDKKIVLGQIDSTLDKYEEARTQHGGIATWPDDATMEMVTLMRATVERFAPPGSAYIKNADDVLKRYGAHHPTNVTGLLGVLRAMRGDYDAGQVQPVHELVHADVFTDFLEMADHLLSEGYKDAAAVIAGAVLEEHLRKLCDKNGITVEMSPRRLKKADALNAELAGAKVYSVLDQKSVTAWLDLRNKAAHGQYNEYTKDQVALLVQGLRDFIVRHPA